MRFYLITLFRSAAVASIAWAVLPHGAFAVGTEPVAEPLVDPAPCFAAIAADDSDQIVGVCGALTDNAKASKDDRLKALIGRAGAYAAKDMLDRAIADYDMVLRLDATLADIFNARGELWRKKGDRRRAVADFGAALKPELQLRDRETRGRKGDLRQCRACQSRPRDHRGERTCGPQSQ